MDLGPCMQASVQNDMHVLVLKTVRSRELSGLEVFPPSSLGMYFLLSLLINQLNSHGSNPKFQRAHTGSPQKETSASLRENNSVGRDRKSQRKGHPSGARADIAVFFQAHHAC